MNGRTYQLLLGKDVVNDLFQDNLVPCDSTIVFTRLDEPLWVYLRNVNKIFSKDDTFKVTFGFSFGLCIHSYTKVIDIVLEVCVLDTVCDK